MCGCETGNPLKRKKKKGEESNTGITSARDEDEGIIQVIV